MRMRDAGLLKYDRPLATCELNETIKIFVWSTLKTMWWRVLFEGD